MARLNQGERDVCIKEVLPLVSSNETLGGEEKCQGGKAAIKKKRRKKSVPTGPGLLSRMEPGRTVLLKRTREIKRDLNGGGEIT